MDRQGPGKLNCFIDKDRPCDDTCKAFNDTKCQILDSLKSLMTSGRKVARAGESLSKILHSRPVPKP